MEDQFRNFISVLESFDQQGVEYILIGGVAMVLHGMERLTRDIDIFVKMEPENIEKLRKALYQVFKDDSIEEITFQELDKYPVIRYGTPKNFYVDIMARIGEMFTYEDLEYEIVNYQSIKIKIATPDTLYKLKKDTIRDRDKIDAAFLRELIRARSADKSD
jgi:predicted nucleotidyltransferase